MQALMSNQYHVEPEARIYRPKLSRMKIKTFLIINITGTTKKKHVKVYTQQQTNWYAIRTTFVHLHHKIFLEY